ncbi:hypothetical protein Clocl_3778 [Acetivibrio clariflavus DSM 19732]|uniref:Uncharacterized protein n=1 Tax=Acetivibrio clariflavus (strain DSM 19732 / NBRC 101661 / EBR45) TaxID=720554 RepID=G8M0Y7_ACECE|nr:hypothetical protein Clocl_3778 [Acetivibrio clariflavus DSM 19732]
MGKHYCREQNNTAFFQDEAILTDFINIKYVNMLKKNE